jgi:hypothetical protein
MTLDPDEKSEYIAMAKANYISGEFDRTRCAAILVMAGYNATEIEDFFTENRDAAFAAMVDRGKKQGPVR